MKIKAEGQLGHRFHGEYSAVIGLWFEEAEQANLALASNKLGQGWQVSDVKDSALVWVGDSEALNKCEDCLEALGADRKKISSLKYSVDYGEKFSIEFEVVDSKQMELFK